MAGLIGSNIGQAISNIGANVGNLMFKSISDEADRDARIAAKKEEWQARLEERKEAREQNDTLRRDLAALKMEASGSKSSGGGGGKSGGVNLEDIKPGGSQEVWAAAKLEMTVPEYTAFYNSLKTGDKSAFLQEVTRTTVPAEATGEMSDAVSRKTAVRTPETVKALLPGFEAEYKAKMKKLADLQESYALGGQYDDIMKGRQQGFQTGVGQGILSKEITGKDVGVASQAVASSTGKESYAVQGGEKLNQFTGESTTTPKGLSEIQENKAQAGKAATGGGTKAPRVQSTKEDADGNMILIMSDGTTKPMLGEDGKTVRSASFNKEVSKLITKMAEDDLAFRKLPPEEQRKKAEQRLTGRMEDTSVKTNAPATSMPEPKSAADLSKLKPGTRYKAPDGTIRIKG